MTTLVKPGFNAWGSPQPLRNAGDYYSRGLGYHIENNYDRAIADYTAAIRLDPKNAEYYSARGDAYMKKRTGIKQSPTTRRP